MHQIAPFKKKFWESMPRTPLANAWQGHASQAAARHATRPTPKKLGLPLASHSYSHGQSKNSCLFIIF